MQPDVATEIATPAEKAWVRAELIHSLMRTALSTQWAGVLLIPLVLAVLWNDAGAVPLLLWAGASLAMAAARQNVLHRYSLEADAARQMATFRRVRYLWPASAFVWGTSVLLYFDRSPLADQFVCWLILAGLAMVSMNSLSAHLRTLRRYLDSLAFTALAIMLWRMGVELQFRGPYYHYWVIALLLIFWQLLRQAGLRLHLTHRRNFELQYRNTQLIESLTRQTQAALEAVEIKNRFLASAAHDLRQPVLALGLYAGWLGSEPELAHEIAPKIVESTKAVNALFDSLFDLVGLDTGKVKLNIEPVDLRRLLHDLELQYWPLARAKGLEFRVRATPGLVMSDPLLLRRIVGNLISNAVKYTERGGVLIASRHGRDGSRIEVWDTGLGIAPVHQREIFREFYKVPAHAGTEEGFGLGLYIVSRLAGILGHPLSLASRQGKGTVSRLMLGPVDPLEAAERAASHAVQLASIP